MTVSVQICKKPYIYETLKKTGNELTFLSLAGLNFVKLQMF